MVKSDSQSTPLGETSSDADRGGSEQQERAAAVAAPLTAALRSWQDAARDQPELERQAKGLDAAIEQVQTDISLILNEHEGMTNELLRTYEQLGIVFDITGKLMSLRTEDEVVGLFVESLRPTYSDVTFLIVRPHGKNQYHVAGDRSEAPDWLLAVVDVARGDRRVHPATASSTPTADMQSGDAVNNEALVAPVIAGDSFVCAIALWRNHDSGRWESGDMLLLDSLATFCGDLIRNFRLLQELQRMSMDMVRSLVNAVDQKDPYTSGHSTRVGYYAAMLGRQYGLDEERSRTLEWSALLHDVGKIGIRDNVLKKPGKLTDEEFEHIKEHPLRGYEVLREIPQMREALDGVLYHHEQYGGKGYPKGLKGEEIPLQARLIQIADIFDALTTTRSYRDAFSWRKALSIMEQEAGSVVDPNLVTMFATMLHTSFEQNPQAFDSIGQPDAQPDLIHSPAPDSGRATPNHRLDDVDDHGARK